MKANKAILFWGCLSSVLTIPNGYFLLASDDPKEIFVDLVRKSNVQYDSSDDFFVYKNSLNEYDLTSGIQITVRGYEPTKNITMQIASQKNTNENETISISKEEFDRFATQEDGIKPFVPGMRQVFIDIDTSGHIRGLSPKKGA
jgi:hypothetical protein